MFLHEREFKLSRYKEHRGLLDYFSSSIEQSLQSKRELPVRFAITKSDQNIFYCEVGTIARLHESEFSINQSVFDFKERATENTDHFTSVLLIPTGIGAEIGGHSGDGGALARLMAAASDTLITHPNVVNAADINELPENGLYVEGSVITRLLMGTVGLERVRSNRVLLVVDKHEDEFMYESTINSISAARVAMGIECPLVVVMEDQITSRSMYSSSGRAVGRIDNFERLCNVLEEHRSEYDAVALSTIIWVPEVFHGDYFDTNKDIVNPWGGVEAMLTHALSLIFDVPSAHSPMMESRELLEMRVGIVDPRKAAEAVSVTYLHSIIKGLHKSPRIVPNPPMNSAGEMITASDISCLIIPDGCIGLPTLAAIEQGIPVIAVKENKNRMENNLEDLPFAPGKLFVVDNYLEAIGVMQAIKAGVVPATVRRPISETRIETYVDSNLKAKDKPASVGKFSAKGKVDSVES